MRKTTLSSLIALFAATVGLAGCGVPPEDLDSAPQAVQPGMTPVERLPLLDKLPDSDFPPGFNHERGWSEYRLPSGKRALFLTRGEIDPQLAEDERASQAFVDLNPYSDTWYEKLTNGTHRDYGRACELRVNNVDTQPLPQRAALKFAVPSTVTCTTITEARLTLTTAQNPGAGSLVVSAHRASAPWTQGGTGYVSTACSSCAVGSGTAASFVAPGTSSSLYNVNVTSKCTRYAWIVTTAAKDWCMNPTFNYGLVMAGHGSGAATVSFHAMDAPANRPLLTIVY